MSWITKKKTLDGQDEKGQFMPGNQIWKRRSHHGHRKGFLFPEPEDLERAAIEYFEWVQANPLYEAKSVGGKIQPVEKMRAMTLHGLCLFIGISKPGWDKYVSREKYSETCEWIATVIYEQKFTGAAAGLLNHSIISRELGLADKKEVSNPDGTLTPPSRIEIVGIPASVPEDSDDGNPD